MANLSDNVRYLKGIGEQRAKGLAKLGINTLRDLVCYFPRTYEDRTKSTPIAAAQNGQSACIHGLVASEPTLSRVRRGMDIVKLRAVDESGSIDITYFNQSYIRQQIKAGESYIFYGKVTVEGRRVSMTNPLFEKADGEHTVTGRIVPIYRLTTGLSQKMLISGVRQGLEECGMQLPNALPELVATEQNFCQTAFAYENIHFPSDFLSLDLSRRRLIFEELFVLACALAQIKKSRSKRSGAIVQTPDMSEFFSALPFEPTGAQKRAISEALSDMSSGNAMNRLIQGDVGSGKTLVAAACVWAAHLAGCQSAFMAPTEILANQHFRTLSQMLEPMGLKVIRLVGSMTAKEKREAYAVLESGEAALAVGTHALISEGVVFNRLGLVIADEPHRFGVAQRAALNAKGESPHTLIMSATPIPRTMALMIYGDLDVSVIDEMPPGRQEIDTFSVTESMRPRINAFIRKQVEEGHQVFIVCPAIEEDEERPQNLKSAVEHAEDLAKNVFPDLRIACLHGKVKTAEKDKTMLAFLNGEIDILVSTTVIEVGVDVPNASLMVIENAERFGLSQLHQLRGRVGRGAQKSYCVLFSDAGNPVSQERLKVMESTNDGFRISEEDLKLRGPGDFFGSRQHGLPEMHIADFCTDLRMLKDAQEAAARLLEADPDLKKAENACLKNRIEELFEINSNAMN